MSPSGADPEPVPHYHPSGWSRINLHLKSSPCLSLSQNYEAFFDAREDNAVYAFLGLTAPPGSKVRAGQRADIFDLEPHPYSRVSCIAGL